MWHRSCGTSRAVAPLHVPVTPVSRRSMSTARIGARPITEFAPLWLLCLLWLFFQFHWNPLLAWADETSPPPPSNAAAKIELSASAEAPETGAAPAPAPKMVADSIATAAPAVRDSSAKAPDAPGSAAKEGQPAEHIENAVTVQNEKTAEVAPAAAPNGVAKPPDAPSKVPEPLPGAGPARKPHVSVGIRGGATPRNQIGAVPPNALPDFTESDRVATEPDRPQRFAGR